MTNPIKAILCFLIATAFLMLLMFFRQSHGEQTFNEFIHGTWWIIGFFFTFLAIGTVLINKPDK
jgi:hypothetical protein